MKIYILMVVLGWSGSGVSVGFQEFNTLTQCRYAASLLQKDFSVRIAQCVEK